MKIVKIIIVAVILAIISFGAFYYFVKPHLGQQLKPPPEKPPSETPPEQTQPSFETPETYGFGVFAYKGVEVSVGEVSAPSYELPLKLEEVENIDNIFYPTYYF